MANEQKSSVGASDTPKNRPNCLYLWYIRGEAVCSEAIRYRPCAYPFWDCPVRIHADESFREIVPEKYPVLLKGRASLDESGLL